MKFLGLWLIRAYQRCISPLFPPVCKYSPSCSHYTYQSIDRHGLLCGVLLGSKRLCRCHPWAAGGPDPVPETIRWSWTGPVRKGPPPVYDFGASLQAAGAGASNAPRISGSAAAAMDAWTDSPSTTGAPAPATPQPNPQRARP